MLRFNRFGIQSTAVSLSLMAAGVIFSASTTVGCHATDPTPTPSVANTTPPATTIPFVRKKPDFGGEACLTMVLQNKGLPIDQDWAVSYTHLTLPTICSV